MMALGILGFIYGGFALVWQSVPGWVPARQTLAYVCAAISLGGGLALLWRLPWHVGWAQLTGGAYIAAGLAIVTATLARLAASLAAVMMSLITLLVWVPALVNAPRDRLRWTALVTSLALAASAWVVADSFRLWIPGRERRYRGVIAGA
jgi:hypothetical protein